MKLKKQIGCFLLMLAAIVSTSGNASILSVGVEDMPQSMKNKR